MYCTIRPHPYAWHHNHSCRYCCCYSYIYIYYLYCCCYYTTTTTTTTPIALVLLLPLLLLHYHYYYYYYYTTVIAAKIWPCNPRFRQPSLPLRMWHSWWQRTSSLRFQESLLLFGIVFFSGRLSAQYTYGGMCTWIYICEVQYAIYTPCWKRSHMGWCSSLSGMRYRYKYSNYTCCSYYYIYILLLLRRLRLLLCCCYYYCHYYILLLLLLLLPDNC